MAEMGIRVVLVKKKEEKKVEGGVTMVVGWGKDELLGCWLMLLLV